MSDSTGQDVVQLETLPIGPGQDVRLTFDSVNSPWRQGVWLATDGTLRVNRVNSSQMVLWQDTAPRNVEIEVVETDGALRFYNVRDSGRALGDHESHSATSGMLVQWVSEAAIRYRCNDIGHHPAFDKLIFTLRAG